MYDEDSVRELTKQIAEDGLNEYLKFLKQLYTRMEKENSWPWVVNPGKWEIDCAVTKTLDSQETQLFKRICMEKFDSPRPSRKYGSTT